jgi:hypothetical protein
MHFFCQVSRACSSRMGPCILLMLPQLDQDGEQRPVSLQPADDGLKIGPEVMPVSSVTLSDGARSGERAPTRSASVASSGKGQCYRQGLVHALRGGR